LPALAAFLLGPPLLPIFVGAVAVIMAWEWVRVTGARVFGVTGTVLAAHLIGGVALAAWGLYVWAYAALAAAVAIVYVVARAHAREHAFAIAGGALYVGVPAICLLWLYARPDVGRGMMIWLICVVIATDIAAYFVGRALRGPKLAPRISPGKTGAGAAGGVGAALAVGVAGGAVLDGATSLLFWACAAFAIAVVSEMGDLLESGVKRVFSVKDTSGILPGHGGMMDRVDGIVAALVAAALVVWIGGGDPRTWL
jgi:phosphatidate cytidylyltransferase